MNFFLDLSITLNISGLIVLSALESARPGMVSSAVNVGLVWLIAVILMSLGLLIKNQPSAKQ